MIAVVTLVVVYLLSEAACDVEAWLLYWALTRVWKHPVDEGSAVCSVDKMAYYWRKMAYYLVAVASCPQTQLLVMCCCHLKTWYNWFALCKRR